MIRHARAVPAFTVHPSHRYDRARGMCPLCGRVSYQLSVPCKTVSEADLVEAVWQKRAISIRRLNRRLWIKRVAGNIALALIGAVVLASLLYAVLLAFLHGHPSS